MSGIPCMCGIPRRTRTELCDGVGGRWAAVDATKDVEWVGVLEFRGKSELRHALVGDRSCEAEDRLSAHGGGATIGGSRPWATVDHCAADFDAGGEAVDHKAAYLCGEHAEEFSMGAKVRFCAVNGRGEMPTEAVCRLQELTLVTAMDEESGWAKDLF